MDKNKKCPLWGLNPQSPLISEKYVSIKLN